MTSTRSFEPLLAAVAQRRTQVIAYLENSATARRFEPDHIRDAAYSYIRQGGKSLRPAVLMLSCGAVGGDESAALPAAAAVEVYHTWTLVHDDIIDRDDKRRGAPTLHYEFAARGVRDLGWEGAEAAHYGLTVALLAGDLQQAWSYALLYELQARGVDAALVLRLATELATTVQTTLVAGELLDVQFSHVGIADLTEERVIDMLWRKTGALYEFAGRAGAAVGAGQFDAPQVDAIAGFCSRCGTAFQIQDDILGLVGNESQLGKPVGSDIREGKRTLITLKALEVADEAQRAQLEHTLGNPAATPDEVAAVVRLARDLGAVEYASSLKRRYIDEALARLAVVPDSDNRRLLELWAAYMIEREF